jgi:uncharacterized membrane protein (DUF441 family)
MNAKPPTSEENKANLRWWIAMAVFSGLLIILNYKHLPSLLADVAKQGLTIAAWILWIKVLMDIYGAVSARKQFNEWAYITLFGASACSLLMWIINDGIKEVMGVLYFALVAAVVIRVVFHPGKKK